MVKRRVQVRYDTSASMILHRARFCDRYTQHSAFLLTNGAGSCSTAVSVLLQQSAATLQQCTRKVKKCPNKSKTIEDDSANDNFHSQVPTAPRRCQVTSDNRHQTPGSASHIRRQTDEKSAILTLLRRILARNVLLGRHTFLFGPKSPLKHNK